jgi:hypothetical protein
MRFMSTAVNIRGCASIADSAKMSDLVAPGTIHQVMNTLALERTVESISCGRVWLVVTASKSAPGVYTGDLYRTSGTRFDAFNGANVTSVKVGTATFTFADGNNATFSYTVQLAGMTSPVTQSKAITREIFTAPGTTCK